ncbi:YceI family protein [Rosistilla oblonga]|uniref:Lipid/polyisoprenoid-binding YceI-like domain-containing protein n=1 Tax=Rosistilla oblonga TaxID=2527990 RepID=A0A518IU07_9BACT|nr:YceI family protein [Rosistilla oblonga]QDV56574.1 hypothetical protein Mal33_25660 [Rosistilla oblonga]
MKKLASLLGICLLSTTCFAQATATTLKPVALQAGTAAISPANSRIDFVGTHEGDKPDPRKGGFGKFTGQAKVAADGSLQSIAWEIETGSLFTEIPKLTGHLKNSDFFDVREYPKASFQSTSVAAGSGEGNYIVTGDLTLLKATKSIKIPVSVDVSAEGLTLHSKFKIDRTQFGMNYGQGKVSNDVQMTVAIGQPTEAAGR